jgi:PadR family transcriptional regulator PadR
MATRAVPGGGMALLVLDIRAILGGMSGVRLTGATVAVLDVLLGARESDPVWGLRVCQDADLGPGTVYPILERLSSLGWVESWWEDEQPSGRPRRRFFKLTGEGRAAVAAAYAARGARRRRWAPRPAGEGGGGP